MIKSFANKESEELFNGIHGHSVRKKMPDMLRKKTERRLDMLNCAESLESLALIPFIKSEGAVRDAHGKYSIPVEGTWRIAFRWDDEGASDVELKS